MHEIRPAVPPRRILLATDLSGRGDRALDRATQLAIAWDAELLIVHAIEDFSVPQPEHLGVPSWRRSDTIADIERSIREDVRGEAPQLRVIVEEGPALRVILDTVSREGCDLVVVGIGRYRVFGATTVGRTTEELVRQAPVSVLVVKCRPNEPYRHILVGTDFTPESRQGLTVAAELFPSATLVLMHAFDMPYRHFMQGTQLGRDFGAMEQATMETFVNEAGLAADVRGRLLTLIEHGRPEIMLSQYVAARRADLTVIGAYERNLLFHVFVGGNGPRIVDIVPSDILVVRASKDLVESVANRPTPSSNQTYST